MLLHTTLKIYNILGHEVRTLVDEAKEPGWYSVTWDGKDSDENVVPSGVYVYVLRAGHTIQAKKSVLMK